HVPGRLAVRSYEVWHHGNSPHLAPGATTSPGAYAATYATVREALHRADPQAEAVVSLAEHGEIGRADRFLLGMVMARPSLIGEIDAVYVMAEASRTRAELDALVRDLRTTLALTGNEGAPIYLGFGAPSGGPEAMPETQRAALLG